MPITVGGQYTKRDRREYQKGYRERAKEKRAKSSEGALEEFVAHVRKEAMKAGAGSAVMGVYKELLKVKIGIRKEEGLSGDVLAGMLIEAERELREGGYEVQGRVLITKREIDELRGNHSSSEGGNGING